MKNQNKVGFTLIELIIVITIIVIISFMVFAPYSFYMKKAKVQYTTKELSQIIYEAKNMAKNGGVNLFSNVSVGVHFDSSDSYKNSYELYSFPHELDTNSLSLSDGTLLKKYNLQDGIQIDNFNELSLNQSKGVIFFQSISGSGKIYQGSNLNLISSIDNEINIDYSHKGSGNPALMGTLIYFQDTQIIDY